MLDVHPPHAAMNTWRDFLIHIATITIGLLIALGLEGGVEVLHHRHIVAEARENIRAELTENQKELVKDERQLDLFEDEMRTNLSIFNDIKAHRKSDRKFSLGWEWDGMQSAAWDTARNTGATALMPYEVALRYSEIYGQQQLVNDQATIYMRNLYRIGTPFATKDISALEPAEVDIAIANTQQTMTDVEYLRDLIKSLDRIYKTRAPVDY